MKIICAILIIVVILGSLWQTTAIAEEEVLPHFSLAEFLSVMEIDFLGYMALMAELEETGVYPHYLDKNTSRYDAFRESNPALPESTVIAYVNVNVDLGPYTDIQEVPEPELSGVIMLVNKNFGLPENWEADDLVNIGAGFMVREGAAEPLTQLRDAMREAGLRMNIMSTYRSVASSARLYNNAVSNWGTEIADLNWARGGHSEHNTGLAADILHITNSPTMTEARFETTEEYTWMKENAHKFGFILRYPQEYEDIHGYKFEPWHWRYVGEDIATAMYDEGIPVYEEFYGKYLLSDVLHNVRRLVLEKQAQAEAEEAERLAIEEADRQAMEEAARIAQEAAQEAAFAAEEAARIEAERLEEEQRLAALQEQERADSLLRRDMIITLLVTLGAVIAMVFIVIGARSRYKKKYG